MKKEMILETIWMVEEMLQIWLIKISVKMSLKISEVREQTSNRMSRCYRIRLFNLQLIEKNGC